MGNDKHISMSCHCMLKKKKKKKKKSKLTVWVYELYPNCFWSFQETLKKSSISMVLPTQPAEVLSQILLKDSSESPIEKTFTPKQTFRKQGSVDIISFILPIFLWFSSFKCLVIWPNLCCYISIYKHATFTDYSRSPEWQLWCIEYFLVS